MSDDTFYWKATCLFLNSLCLIGGVIKVVTCIANLKYADGLNYYILYFALRIMTAFGVFMTAVYGYYGILPENIEKLWRFVILQVVFVVCGLFLMTVRIWTRENVNMAYTLQVLETEPLDFIQKEYKCCGMKSTDEYLQRGEPIPDTCYEKAIRSRAKRLFKESCDAKVENFFADKYLKGTVVFSIFLVVEIISACAAAHLASRLTKIAEAETRAAANA